MKKTLIDIAKEARARRQGRLSIFPYDHPEMIALALAWLNDEISYNQFRTALDIASSSNNVGYIVAMTLRQAIRNGKVSILVEPRFAKKPSK